jgi:demethylmenaquinone methyltransferase/2-methoxy-6-polyprenyl-1,4-benzoquinol methylase
VLSRLQPGARGGDGKLPEGAEKVRAVETMFNRIAPRYDALNRIMTLGLDRGWRRRAVRCLALPRGAQVLDLGCGTGDLCRELGAAGFVAVGVDRSAGMLAARATEAPIVRADALELPFPERSVDGVVSGFLLRNLVSLGGFVAECARVLRAGGRMVLLEVDAPRSPALRAGHAVYFRRVVPWIGGLLSDAAAYRYLPQSVAYLPDGPELLALLRSVGFPDATKLACTGGIAQLLIGTKA